MPKITSCSRLCFAGEQLKPKTMLTYRLSEFRTSRHAVGLIKPTNTKFIEGQKQITAAWQPSSRIVPVVFHNDNYDDEDNMADIVAKYSITK